MAHPHPVTRDTRGDILDPADTHLPKKGFEAKKRELEVAPQP